MATERTVARSAPTLMLDLEDIVSITIDRPAGYFENTPSPATLSISGPQLRRVLCWLAVMNPSGLIDIPTDGDFTERDDLVVYGLEALESILAAFTESNSDESSLYLLAHVARDMSARHRAGRSAIKGRVEVIDKKARARRRG